MPNNVPPYGKKSPCKSCPYRKDAPRAYWDKDHFIDLLNNDRDLIGKVYGCHKQDGNHCIGWLMNQDKRYFPSIALRLDLSKQGITREYLDKLHSSVPMFETVLEMCFFNYPEEFLNEVLE